jgi:transposase InsO family protein
MLDWKNDRIGDPCDNARAESFMKTLKQEEVNGRSYRDAHQGGSAPLLRKSTNRQRLHSASAYQWPAKFEARHIVRGSEFRYRTSMHIAPHFCRR